MKINVTHKGLDSALAHYTSILIIGVVLLAASVLGLAYSSSIVVKDEINHNISGPSSLPKTHVGPFSMYHVEYGFVFLLIVGFAAAFWGWSGRHEQKVLANNNRL